MSYLATQRYRKKSRRNGRCYSCSRPAVKGKRSCQYHLDYHKERRWALKLRAIAHYGGECACCKVTEPKFLTFDHTNNDGAKHRRKLAKNAKYCGSIKFHYWLLSRPRLPSIQLLCWNCNSGRQINGGICPHKAPTVQS